MRSMDQKKSESKKSIPWWAYLGLPALIGAFVLHSYTIKALAWYSQGSLYFLLFSLAALPIIGASLTLIPLPPAFQKISKVLGAGIFVLFAFLMFSFIPGKSSASENIERWNREFADAGLVNGASGITAFLLLLFAMLIAGTFLLSIKNQRVMRVAFGLLGVGWLFAVGMIAHHNQVPIVPDLPYTLELDKIYNDPKDPTPDRFTFGGDYEPISIDSLQYDDFCSSLLDGRLTPSDLPVSGCESIIIVKATGRNSGNTATCIMVAFEGLVKNGEEEALKEVKWIEPYSYERSIAPTDYGYAWCGEEGEVGADNIPPVTRALVAMAHAVEVGLFSVPS